MPTKAISKKIIKNIFNFCKLLIINSFYILNQLMTNSEELKFILEEFVFHSFIKLLNIFF